jgi:hypothetical protein
LGEAHRSEEWFGLEHGKYTAELGRTLRRRMESTGREDLQVFFDHGKDGESQRVVPYFENYDLSTSLAFVDLAVVNKNTKSVLVLCEVEEEGVNPKKVIGDCMNLFVSDRVRIGRVDYSIKNAHFLLGTKVGIKGKGGEKVKSLEARIPLLIKDDSKRGIKLEFVTAPDCKELISVLDAKICGIVNIRIKGNARLDTPASRPIS